MEQEEIIRIIEGRCPAEEREAFFTELSHNPELQTRYEKVKAEYVLGSLPYSAMGGIRSYEEMKGRIVPPKKLNIMDVFYRIAAILVIPLVLLLGYKYISDGSASDAEKEDAIRVIPLQQAPTMKYYADLGVKGYVNLPDGSKVWLNSGTSIEFPAKFDSLKREISLQGEGYFEVVSNKKWPFMVNTSKGITAVVTGTQFNLTCYEEENVFRLSLISGSLYLKRSGGEADIQVKPNEEVIIKDVEKPQAKSSVIKQGEEYVHTTTVWKDGKLVFENTPMSEVISRIERWYGVTIRVYDQSIYDNAYTAQFDTESIVQVLEVLRVTLNLQYSLSGKAITLY